ncbi:unnamed protein product [Notodromas monacha]|uniref:Uncharacterized protein n=1 Tax=Notodromas monacha TaxID=399045 RepID=A0A7R9GE22_9CRUS|nr:unnamed protein product [Notodromas monacha]CAG0917810.1 unnamed protein product [Notodromas monacha]
MVSPESVDARNAVLYQVLLVLAVVIGAVAALLCMLVLIRYLLVHRRNFLLRMHARECGPGPGNKFCSYGCFTSDMRPRAEDEGVEVIIGYPWTRGKRVENAKRNFSHRSLVQFFLLATSMAFKTHSSLGVHDHVREPLAVDNTDNIPMRKDPKNSQSMNLRKTIVD